MDHRAGDRLGRRLPALGPLALRLDAGRPRLRNLQRRKEASDVVSKDPERSSMPGKPVHFEIPAQDASRAQEFYKNLFGWQFQSMEGPVEYHMTRLSEDQGGAVFPG